MECAFSATKSDTFSFLLVRWKMITLKKKEVGLQAPKSNWIGR